MPRLVPHTLSGRLALALNAALVAVLAGFTVWDVRASIRDQINEKREALRDEAEGLAQAINTFDQGDAPGIQRYIDSVCREMRNPWSPGHYILVDTGRVLLETAEHVTKDPERQKAVQEAARSTDLGRVRDESIVANVAAVGPTTVYVAEYVSDIRRATQRSLVRRVLGVSAIATALVLVVNVAIHWLVRRPVQHLSEAMRQVGRGDLGVTAAVPRVKELQTLSGEFNRMSQALALAESDRRQRLDRARRIQQKLLPRPRQVGCYRFEAFHLAADTVAGDYWDLIECPAGWLVLCVADVSGHGVPAAMGAAMLKVLLTDESTDCADPAAVLARVNRRFMDLVLEDDFATMILLRLSPDGSQVAYASAGHEAAVLVNPDRSEPVILDSTGPPIGIDANAAWTSGSHEMRDGDRLIAMTDGLAEATDANGNPLGRDRVVNLIFENRDRPIDELLALLRDAVRAHLAGVPANDDMTVVAIECYHALGPERTPLDARPRRALG